MSLNEKIVLLRKCNNLTQQELGDKLNVTDKAVSKWELSNGTPDIEQIQALSNVFSVSLDYLIKDIVTTEGDKQANERINDYKNKLAKINENDELRVKCKKFLEGQGIHSTDDILPTVESDGKAINMKCFLIDDNGNISLSFDKLVEYRQVELIKKFYSDKILPAIATELDDIDLFEESLKNFDLLNAEYDELPKEGWAGFEYTRDFEKLKRIDRSRQLKPIIEKNNLYEVLENLNSSLENYYYFIVRLIDCGASYTKQIGYGADVTCFKNEIDNSKTQFIYRQAKDMLEIKKQLKISK